MQSQPVAVTRALITPASLNALLFFPIFKELPVAGTLILMNAPVTGHVLFTRRFPGGDNRARTDDPLLAKQVLSQLSYAPFLLAWWVWMDSNHRPPPYQDDALTG